MAEFRTPTPEKIALWKGEIKPKSAGFADSRELGVNAGSQSGSAPIEIPRDVRGRIQWSTLRQEPNKLAAVIEAEVAGLSSHGVQISNDGLEAASKSGLLSGIHRYYPGAMSALRAKFGIYSEQGRPFTTEVTETGLLKDAKSGKTIWRQRGQSREEDEQLAVRNVQIIFLTRFPEFDQLFPRNEQGQISKAQTEQARQFILDHIGSKKKFIAELGGSAFMQPIFQHSLWILLNKTFTPWCLQFDCEKVPDGWFPYSRLARKLQMQESTTKGPFARFINRYRQSHPDWFKEFLVPKGKITECLAPELVMLATASLTKEESWGLAPESWLVNEAVAGQLNRSKSTIKSYVDRYRHSHPDWLKKYRSRSKFVIAEHFSPELVNALKQDLAKPDEGWMNATALATQHNIYNRKVSMIAEDYRLNHPEWFRKFVSRSGTAEYYSPQLIETIERILNSDKEKVITPEEANEYLRRLVEE